MVRRLSQFSKIVSIKTAYLRYAVCGCGLCIKNANCYKNHEKLAKIVRVLPAFINICPILCVSLPLPEFLWRHMIKLSELPVEKTKIVIADLLCDFVDGEICIRQIKAGLAHFLQDDQFFEGAPGFPFDESTEIIGVETKMVGGALQGDG